MKLCQLFPIRCLLFLNCQPATRFVNALIYAVVAGFGAVRIISGSHFTVGQLVTFLNYVNQYTKPFNDISSVLSELQSALPAQSALYSILDQAEVEETGQRSWKVRMLKVRLVLNMSHLAMIWGGP